MKISSAEDTDSGEQQCDVCIIGSGPGGGIPAVQLAKAGFNVLLLEGGPEVGGGGTDDLVAESQVDGHSSLPFTSALQLGGASNLWAGRIAALESIDFAPRKWMSSDGWPLSRHDLPYTAALQLLTGISEHDVSYPSPPAQLADLFHDNGFEIKPFIWAKRPFSVSDHLKATDAGSGGKLNVLVDCPVTKIVEADDGSRIVAAIAKRKKRGTISIKADYFILAAGGIETPRILLSSNDRTPTGIGNHHDLVGRFLSTHPKGDIAVLTLKRPIELRHALFSRKKGNDYHMRFGVGLGHLAQGELKQLNHYVQLIPSLESIAGQGFDGLQELQVVRSKSFSQNRIFGQMLPGMGRFIFNAIEKISLLQGRARRFKLRGFLDQFPDPENRVMLSGENGPFGTERSKVVWKYSDRDRESVRQLLKFMDLTLRKHEIGKIDYSALQTNENWPMTGIHSHFMGTTRMSSSEASGVVDSDCRVFGLSNLYVCGPSVFPTYGYANPFLTIAALGLRLADHIATKRQRNL